MNPLDTLIEHFGGNQSLTARELGMTYQGLRTWVRQGFIPWRKGAFVEKITGGAVKEIDVHVWASKHRHH